MSDVTQPPEDAAPVVLTEPVRQRLVQVASDVLGRLNGDEVPSSLRSVAKFTPARRHRIGAVALSAALDADEEFRAKVAQVVTQASPQLVDAVRERTSTAASDPIDTAVVAYLTRPDGWVEVLAEADARWAGEQRRPHELSAENGRLRKEVAELRVRVKVERARVRDAVAHAGDQAVAETAELRSRLRVRTDEFRAAERLRDDALAAAASARELAEAAATAQVAELRRVRARVAELERASESAKRGTRTDRDVDDARLLLLIDTLTEAAAGIRRELSLAPTTIRPADTVTAATAGATTRSADDPAALDRLLGLPQVHVIVDGYNVTKTGYGGLSLADQRARLVSTMATLGGWSRAEITIAFDGGARPPSQTRTPRGVRVLFSAEGEIADDLIRRLVDAEPPGRPLVVVTSDQQVVTDVRRAGAWTVPSAVLLARLG